MSPSEQKAEMLIGRYPAFLDANVLHPAFLRGALLWFADERLFQPAWSADVLREWRTSIVRRFPDIDQAKLDGQQALMTEFFPDAEISGYENLIDAFSLPDPDDRHVLAAAIIGRCHGIVTANIKHFPEDILAGHRLEIIHPDDFIVNIIDLHPSRAVAACKRHRSAMTATKPSQAEFLKRYEAAGLIQAHRRLSNHVELL